MFSREGEQCLTLVKGLFVEVRVQAIEEISAEADQNFESSDRRVQQGTLSEEESVAEPGRFPTEVG